jgi:hypothetical protein
MIETDLERSIEAFPSPSAIACLLSVANTIRAQERISGGGDRYFPYNQKPPSKLLRGGFSVRPDACYAIPNDSSVG